MKTFKFFLYIIKKKFIVVTVVFFVWLIAFDKNSIISQVKLAHKLYLLQEDKKYYLEQIENDKIETKELLTNPENLEKFAREKYLMKKDSEDIYLIIRRDTVPSKKGD